MLQSYRALDLTGSLGVLCGKILADLGADVIKVEAPGGDPGRLTPPFRDDRPHPERSLYWFAYNTNKRSITLDITTASGRDQFRRLVRTADLVLESGRPGELEALGLGYRDLAAVNPRIVLVSMTPFGQDGPYRHFLGTDLEVMALSGAMSLAGEPDGPPLRITLPQAPMWVGAEAAVGALTALYHRERTGRGQHVDVSAQAAVGLALTQAPVWWDMHRLNPQRAGVYITGRSMTGAKMRAYWPCRDGWVNFILYGGAAGRRTNQALVAWMAEHNMAPPALLERDWSRLDVTKITQAEIDDIEAPVAAFFRGITKAEFLAGVVERGMLGYPVSTAADILADPHLEARGFWQDVYHPGLQVRIRYPGCFARFSRSTTPSFRRAPLAGEHNAELLGGDAGPTPSFSASAPSSLPGAASTTRAGALDGIKVVIFGGFAAGPQVGTHLANCGATVVHVESRQCPDGFRYSYPPFKDHVAGVNRSGTFNHHNDSQLGVTLNLKTPGGRTLAQRLAAWADVLIENFIPGTAAKLGIGFDELQRINPRLIMLSTCNMGQTGPRARHPGFGSQLSALAGFTHLTGEPDGPPEPVYGPYIDFVAVIFGGVAITAALLERERSGIGQHIDLAQYETGLQFIAPALLDATVNGRVPGRDGNRDPDAAPHNAYPCRDEVWLAMSCWNDAEWSTLCSVAGHPEWSSDPRFATGAARKAHEAELDRQLAAWTAAQDAKDLMHRLQARGVRAGVVNTMRDLLEDDQLAHREAWQVQVHPEIGAQHHRLPAYRLSETPPRVFAPAPCLGQHNRDVFIERLGVTPEDYDRLERQGVFE